MQRQHQLILGALLMAEVCSAFESSMILAALSSWIRIHKDPVLVGWIVTSYLLVAGSSAAVAGRLGDMYGRRKVLLVLLAACAIGSLISAVGNSMNWIIVGRSIQGLAGGILPLVYAILREHLPKERVPQCVGVIVAGATLSGTLGLLLGGLVTDNFGPNSVFWTSFIIAALSFAAVISFIPWRQSSLFSGRIDLLGGILFCPMIALILFGVSRGNHLGWSSPLVLGCIVSGIAGLAVWTWHELRIEQPLINVRLLRDRGFLFANVVMICCAIGAMQATQLVSMLVQQPVWTGVGLGLSATMMGLIKIPSTGCGTLGSLVSGWACGRFGPRSPMIIGNGAAGVGLAFGAVYHDSILVVIVILIIATFGVTTAYAAIPSAIMAVVPSDRTGEATGLMAVARSMSRAVGSQVLVLLLAASTITDAAGVKHPDDFAYTSVFAAMACASFLGMFLSFGLPLPRKAPEDEPAERGAVAEPKPGIAG